MKKPEKSKGILFTDAMVRGLLRRDGMVKTMTRRLVKFREFGRSDTPGYDWTFRDRQMLWNDLRHAEMLARCPYGGAGRRMYAKECHAFVSPDELKRPFSECNIEFRADSGATHPGGWDHAPDDPEALHWRPSIFLPRWAARITMTLADVRIERVDEISEADAVAEGIVEYPQGPLMHRYGLPEWDADERCATAREAFLKLFYGINKRAPAGANPWVWVLTLTDIAVHGKAVAA